MNINYRETWNELCFHINGNRNYLERDFQNIIEFYLFEKLGWSKYKGEIVSQKSISVGSANSVNPDIIINNEGNNVLVVELKRASQSISSRNTEQLISYMRLLRLNLGLLIGDTLQVYYDNPNDNKEPIRVLEIPFEEDYTEGIRLLELLSKENFSNENLEEYSISHLSRIAEVENINKYINLLCSVEGKEVVLGLLREKLLEDLSDNATEEILSQVVLNISRKGEPVVNTFENKYDGEGFTHSEMNDRRSIEDVGIKTARDTKKGISKSKAKELCYSNDINIKSGKVTFASKNKSAYIYWANPNIKNLNEDWWLLLNDDIKNKIHVFSIPANSLDSSQLKRRSGDKSDLIDLQIRYNDDSFEDSRSKEQFKKWHVETIDY